MGFKRNYVNFIGSMGKDAEVVSFESGAKIVKFNLAISESYKNKNDEWVDKTHWVSCIYQNKSELAIERAAGLKKGDTLFVEGSINENKYTNSEGKNVSRLEIRVNSFQVERKGKDSTPANHNGMAQNGGQAPAPGSVEMEDDDSDLPF